MNCLKFYEFIDYILCRKSQTRKIIMNNGDEDIVLCIINYTGTINGLNFNPLINKLVNTKKD